MNLWCLLQAERIPIHVVALAWKQPGKNEYQRCLWALKDKLRASDRTNRVAVDDLEEAISKFASGVDVARLQQFCWLWRSVLFAKAALSEDEIKHAVRAEGFERLLGFPKRRNRHSPAREHRDASFDRVIGGLIKNTTGGADTYLGDKKLFDVLVGRVRQHGDTVLTPAGTIAIKTMKPVTLRKEVRASLRRLDRKAAEAMTA